MDSENINIYRNLAGGVVAAQLLHGSANPIGGQSAIIKMRWGEPADGLLIEDAPEFIKFALGENVKRSRNPFSFRYPQTRMGVEQVFVNAFSQAQEYGKTWEDYRNLSRAQQRNALPPRRDLVDEAMLEVLNERFVTSHSYVQSEINMLMNVADSFGFNINTFTHIPEGPDKMAAHGAGGSTFADWWATMGSALRDTLQRCFNAASWSYRSTEFRRRRNVTASEPGAAKAVNTEK